MRLARASVAMVVVLSAGSLARAQLPADDPDTQAAKRHFQRGSKLYTEEHYQDAIDEFEKARALRPLPAFDYNIGRCEDRLEHWRAAADAYERYLAAAPNAAEADELRERIRLLRSREPQSTATIAPPPVEKRPTLIARSVERKPLLKRPWFWIAVGGGVAVVTAVIVVGVIVARPGDPSHPIMDVHF